MTRYSVRGCLPLYNLNSPIDNLRYLYLRLVLHNIIGLLFMSISSLFYVFLSSLFICFIGTIRRFKLQK